MNPPIRIVAGLGNPGKEYEQTRHNAGFWFVDVLARELGAAFKKESKFHGHVARAGNVWIVKPATFMNKSGLAVGSLAKFYQVEPAEVLVVHDEMDLSPGAMKMKIGGAAGNNGVKDIVAQLATREFWRLRVGIGHPRELAARFGGDMTRDEVVDYVLHRPDKADRKAIDAAIDRAIELWPLVAQGDMEAAMLRLHTKPASETAAKTEPTRK
jgi:peptidyl-tRNA hydrolase, PTH1 family